MSEVKVEKYSEGTKVTKPEIIENHNKLVEKVEDLEKELEVKEEKEDAVVDAEFTEKEDISELNVFQRMQKITSELRTVGKNLDVGWAGNSYKGVSEVDILNAVKPLEEKYGIYSYPKTRIIVQEGERTTNKGGFLEFIRIETDYAFTNVDKPKEEIIITSYGDGLDSGDKSVGKAMTYADKYALMKAYKISTGDDPENTHSDKLKADEGEEAYSKSSYRKQQQEQYAADQKKYAKQRPAQQTKRQTKQEAQPEEQQQELLTANQRTYGAGLAQKATPQQVEIVRKEYNAAQCAQMAANKGLADVDAFTLQEASEAIKFAEERNAQNKEGKK